MLVRSFFILLTVLLICCSVSSIADPLFKSGESIPADATVLFDGKDLTAFNSSGSDNAATWAVENGYCSPKGSNICSKAKFKDCQLHMEFWLPLMADAKGQARANSGVFFMGYCYEIQILDSYGLTSGDGDCGAIYSRTPPMVNACRPPETWQSYDIVFHAAKFDESGKKTANARVTVVQNGVLIHDNAEIAGLTTNRENPEPKEAGPIELQNHGCPVRFRNIWVRAL